jgi:polyisoprenoid-binding protein YceI
MRHSPPKIAFLTLFLVALFFQAQAQTPYLLKLSKMTVNGTSTMHDWESTVSKVEWAGTLTLQGTQLTEVKDAQIKVTVTDIKSTKGKVMDNKTYEAFKYEKYPTIQYKLTNAKIAGSGADYTINSTGNLTMAGATKSIDMPVKAKVQANGDVLLTGSYKVNMLNFKMEPPTAMMGAIKVGEEVTVHFELTVTPKK